MKSNAPWSVKGIERDARETAKEAARRQGLTVGEWLNQMIYSHGNENAASGGEVEGLKLRDIVTAIEHLRNRIVEAEKKSAGSVSDLSRNVGGVVERVQRLERVKPASGSYQDLAGRLEKLEAAGGDRNRIDALKALEKAVSQVAVQFSSAQKTTLHRLDSAEEQLQEFAERIDQVGLNNEPADISGLQETIEGLAARVAAAENAANEAASLKEAAADSIDPEFVEQTGAKLRVLGDEIKRGGDQIRAFEGAVAKLSDQIEAAEKRSADGVQKVSETIADIRSQFLSEERHSEDKTALENKLSEARRETEERMDALHRSFEEMNARMRELDERTIAAPQESVQETVTEDATAGPAAKTQADVTQDGLANEIEEAVAALEAETEIGAEDIAEEDPFAFADDDIEAEAEDEDDTPVEDFSFQLDDDEDETPSEVEAEAVEDVGDAQSRLEKVRSALGGADFTEETEDNGDVSSENDADEINAILADLDEGAADLDIADDDDEQSPKTASLTLDDASTDTAGTGLDEAAPSSFADTFSQQSEEDDAPEDVTETVARETTPSSELDTDEEDYQTSARRRAEEAAAAPEDTEDSKRPTRRSLTPKQRAILAARARQKKLTAEADEDTPIEASVDADISAQLDAEIAENLETPEEAPAGRFAKITSALSAARNKLRRGDGEDASAEDSPAIDEATSTDSTEQVSAGNGDRAALEKLKSTSAARPVTLALGGAIVVAVGMLGFLMKDMIFKPAETNPTTVATNPPVEQSQTTPAEDTQTAADTSATETTTDLPVVPEAPAIDPGALYAEAMSDLSAANSESEAIIAIGKLQDAAALGFPPAQLQLGELYKTGQGVEQDLGQARVWFRRAANGGNVLAMHRIGVMTARGDGGPADAPAAIGWFEKAANLGLVDSQYNLGAIYHPSENGGAVQDAEKAYYWYSLAAQNGDDAARPLAAGIAAGLTNAERAAVDEQIAQWQAQEADPIANTVSAAG